MSFRFAALAVALLSAATLAHATPKVTKKVPPEYPVEAVRKNINSGSVRAKLTIAPDGKVAEVEVVEAEPKRVFDRAAVEALKEWRFEPSADKQTHEVKLTFRNDD
jgi:protein TonB